MSYINNVSSVEMDNIKVEHLSTSSLILVTVKIPKTALEDAREKMVYIDYDEAIDLR